MRDTAFIICEYNPFHNGHALHIRETRAAGAKYVVCVMSGNYVQRGEPAFCDKQTRAAFAIENGADLVLEIPLKFVVSGAPRFAEGAINVIRSLNEKGTLSFGSSADINTLQLLAAFSSDPDILLKANVYSQIHGTTFAYSLHRVILDVFPEGESVLQDANNILASEYIKAIQKCGCDLDLFSVLRVTRHDSDKHESNIASGKHIRDLMYAGKSPDLYERFLPENVMSLINTELQKGSLPADKSKFSVAAMSRLYLIDENDLRSINGVNQGLENRIIQCLKDTSDLYLLYDAVKTKRFTHARIRQILISSVLGIKKEALERPNPYVRVLGMNKKGRALLRHYRQIADVPLIMNLSEAPECEERTWDANSGQLYDLCRPVPFNKSPEYVMKPYVSE